MFVADSPRCIVLVSITGREQRVTRIVNGNILSNRMGRWTGQSTHQSVAIQGKWRQLGNVGTYSGMGSKRVDAIGQSGTGLIGCHGRDSIILAPEYTHFWILVDSEKM